MSLRLILMIIGLLVIAAIVVDGYRHWRRARKQAQNFEKQQQRLSDHEPVFKSQDIDDNDVLLSPKKPLIIDEVYGVDEPIIVEAEQQDEPILPQPAPAAPSNVNTSASHDKIIIFHVLAAPNMHFSGVDLAAKFAAQGLHYGPMHIFHQYQNADGSGPILFSVANAFEPGTLNLDYPESFYTRGLTLFMQLSPKIDPEKAFENMLSTATALSKSLHARLCDHRREPLTVTMVQQYRKQVASMPLIMS